MESEHAETPAPTWRFRAIKCAGCNAEIQVGHTKHKAAYCGACRVRRYVENLQSMVSKSGAPYERAVAARHAQMERDRPGGGSDDQGA